MIRILLPALAATALAACATADPRTPPASMTAASRAPTTERVIYGSAVGAGAVNGSVTGDTVSGTAPGGASSSLRAR